MPGYHKPSFHHSSPGPHATDLLSHLFHHGVHQLCSLGCLGLHRTRVFDGGDSGFSSDVVCLSDRGGVEVGVDQLAGLRDKQLNKTHPFFSLPNSVSSRATSACLYVGTRFVITVASCVTCSAIYTGCAVWGVYVILAHVRPKTSGQGGGGGGGGGGGSGSVAGGAGPGFGLQRGMRRPPPFGDNPSSTSSSVCSREGMFTLVFRVAASIAGVVGGAFLGGFVGIATGVPVSLTIAMMYVDSIKCEFCFLDA